MKLKFDQADEMSPLTKKVMGAYNFCGDKLYWLAAKINAIPGAAPEWLFLVLYILLGGLMMTVHEPGMDAYRAWHYAKTSPVLRLLFTVPKEQFCPPLWNLLLAPFAKMGIGFEAVPVAGYLLSVIVAALILHKAPFTRAIRLLLPFTYFLFYQYGIAAGTYHLTMLAFVLLALTYPKRDTRPFGYILSLLLLGQSSSYGLAMSLGLGIWLLYEQWKGKKKTKCLAGLAVFFLISAATAILCVPAAALTAGLGENNLIRILYILFSAVSDGFLTNTYYMNTPLTLDTTRYSFLAVSTIIGIVFLALVFYCGKKKKTAGVFFAPYLCFAAFSMAAGIGREQTGLMFLLILFWLWVNAKEKPEILPGMKCRERDKKAMGSTAALVIVLFFAIHLNWTVSACLHDVRKDNAIGKREAEFLKGYDPLRGCTFMSGASCYPALEAYMEDDVRTGDDSASEKNKARWKQWGQPDVLYMNPDPAGIWSGEEMADWDYTLVYLNAVETIWKADFDYDVAAIYIRSDLAKELGLEEIHNTFPQVK